MDVFPKFIIEGNELIIAKCTYHRQLVSNKDKVKGGGLWKLDRDKKEFMLFGQSEDFGSVVVEDVKACIDAGKVHAGSRNFSDYTFDLNTGPEVIKVN